MESCSRAHYVLTFIDNYLGYALVAFIRNKDATSQHFQAIISWAETFTGHSSTSVHSDQGGEFMAGKLQLFFHSKGVTHQTSVPHTPQQMVGQRGSIELCLKKQKPYTNMLVCHDPSGKMLLKLHCIFIIDNHASS